MSDPFLSGGDWLLNQVDDSRKPLLRCEAMYRREEFLQTFEALLTFHLEQSLAVTLTRIVPPSRRQRGIRGDVFLLQEMKARLLDQAFVDSRRCKQEKTDLTAQRQLVVGDRARDHHRIREDRAPAGAKHAAPILEHAQAIRKVVHRINTEERVEGVV